MGPAPQRPARLRLGLAVSLIWLMTIANGVHLTTAQAVDGPAAEQFVSAPWRIWVQRAVRLEPAAVGTPVSSGAAPVVVVLDVMNWSERTATLDAMGFALVPEAEVPSTAAMLTTISDVNLRSGPSTDTAIVTTVAAGTNVSATGSPENGFTPVVLSDGSTGWIASDFLGGAADTGAPAGVPPDVADSASLATDLQAKDPGAPSDLTPNQSVRLALQFPVSADSADVALRFGDVSIPLQIVDGSVSDLQNLPAPPMPPTLLNATPTGVGRGDELDVDVTADPALSTIGLFGIEAPEGFECYGTQSADRLQASVGATVLLEKIANGQYLVWRPDTDTGQRTLVNAELLAVGAVGVRDADRSSAFGPWFAAEEQVARTSSVGLWGECTGLHGTTPPPPTPVPTATPFPAEQRAQYPILPDVRELAIRPGGLMGQKFSFSGTILTIRVATPGKVFVLGDSVPTPASVAMQVTVPAPNGSTETVFVAYDGDTTGMFEGSWVTVYGEVVGTQSGTNPLGGEITQPLVKAEFVDLG